MIKLLLILLLLVSCNTINQNIKYTEPPEQYKAIKVDNYKNLLKEYNNLMFHIVKWQKWYNLNISNNYYSYTNDNIEKVKILKK